MGFGAWYASAHPEGQREPPGVAPELAWIVLAAAAVLAAAIMWWTVGRLKRIELDDDELVISNYRTEIRVPLADINKISGPSATNPRRYRITFADSTEFGRSVSFMPPKQWSLWYAGKEEEVELLRRAWEEAQARASRRKR